MKHPEMQAGGSKSRTAERDGSGAKVQATTEGVKKVDASIPSTTKGKPSTSRTSKLTADQVLEILQQSLYECQRAGIKVEVVPEFYFAGTQYAAIMLPGVTMVNGILKKSDGNQPEK